MILSLLLLTAQAIPGTVPPTPPARLRADADRDGAITRAEMVARAEAMFARQDADRDGKVTAAERRAAMQTMAARRSDRPMRPEGRGMKGPMADGEVTLAEVRARAERRFDRLDANRDGRLDAAERPGRGRPRGRRNLGDGDMPPPPPAD